MTDTLETTTTTPRNATTGRPYTGGNVERLSGAGSWFLTFKQARKAGGTVRKGERGIALLRFTTKEVEEEGKKVKKRVGVRFTVFALSQCDMPQDFEALPLD